MPVMGPDMEGARKEGEEQARLWLKEKFPYPGPFIFNSEARWQELSDTFIKTFGELCSEDAANGF